MVRDDLQGERRFLMEVDLAPIQGHRFQPTGFPDLGAATFTAPDGTDMLLVESAQSMANRLENVCWDEEAEELIESLKGLPYVHVDIGDDAFTNSILEAHRINSEYIIGNKTDGNFDDTLEEEIGYDEQKPVPYQDLYRALLKYDPNSLIHGAFLEEIAGRLEVERMLSAFIEAENVEVAQSGGVKFSRVEPGAGEGEGNVPYPRTEYTAETITAYFNLDLTGLRGFSLPEVATDLLVDLSLLKIRRFLNQGLRLRTACDLKVDSDLRVTRPDGFSLPDEESLATSVSGLIEDCSDEGLFAEPPITTLSFEG